VKTAKFLGVLVVTLAPWAHAQEAAVTAPQARNVSTGRDFAAVNGQYGAGLSFSPEQTGRVYGEIGFHTQSDSLSFAGSRIETSFTFLSWLLGGGYKVSPEVELELMLPMAFADFSLTATSGIVDDDDNRGDSGVVVGNLHAGVNWLKAAGPVRMKLGAALEYGPWTSDPSEISTTALGGALAVRGMHEFGLWAPERFSIVTPSRVEFGDDFVVSADFALGIHLSTDSDDAEISVQLDPGVGYYVSRDALLGVRLPIGAVPTSDGSDNAQIALEPFVRVGIGDAFLNLRFTMNLDEPYGFAFDEGKVWGLHVGAGGSF
jgi:hypothetical protein